MSQGCVCDACCPPEAAARIAALEQKLAAAEAERDLMVRAIESAGALAGTSGGKPFLDVPELDRLREAAGDHVSFTGACEDAAEGCVHCHTVDCTYCALSKALGDTCTEECPFTPSEERR